MKQFPPRPHFLAIITLLGILSLTNACNRGPSEFDLRVLQHLKSHNRIDANEFDDVIADGRKKIEEQTKNGNMKFAYLIPLYQQLHADHNLALAHFDRLKSPMNGAILATLEEKELIDSVSLAVNNWHSSTQSFCTNFRDRSSLQMDFCDSQQVTESEIKSSFSSAMKANWATELELLQSQITDEALLMAHYLESQMHTTICFPMDTLVLLNFTNGNAIQAGEEAHIGLKVTLHFNSIKPEYKGTGRIEMNPGGSTATLHIKTSEDMIPKGQNEAEIPYTSKALVPKADGSIIELHTEGKIKIRRPCKSQ